MKSNKICSKLQKGANFAAANLPLQPQKTTMTTKSIPISNFIKKKKNWNLSILPKIISFILWYLYITSQILKSHLSAVSNNCCAKWIDRTDIFLKIVTCIPTSISGTHQKTIEPSLKEKKTTKKIMIRKLRLAHHKNSLLKIRSLSKKFSYRDTKDVKKTHIYIYV